MKAQFGDTVRIEASLEGGITEFEKPTDWVIEGAFLAGKGPPIVSCGPDATGRIVDCHAINVRSFTPLMFRRPRLQRFAPLAQRIHAVGVFWKWTA